MQSKAATVKQYLAELPADRRAVIEVVRRVILANVDQNVEEGMLYGMIGFYIPHRVYPAGYHCNPKDPLGFVCLASQKNHLALYLSCVYPSPAEERWFREAWKKTGKKLDKGKSCIRFKKVEDLALDVLGEAIRRTPSKKFSEYYERVLKDHRKRSPAKKKEARPLARKKPPAKKAVKKKAVR